MNICSIDSDELSDILLLVYALPLSSHSMAGDLSARPFLYGDGLISYKGETYG